RGSGNRGVTPGPAQTVFQYRLASATQPAAYVPSGGSVPPSQQSCDGCLGLRQCWVCLGTGHTDTPDREVVCGRCAGSGICPLCREKAIVIDLVDPEETNHSAGKSSH